MQITPPNLNTGSTVKSALANAMSAKTSGSPNSIVNAGQFGAANANPLFASGFSAGFAAGFIPKGSSLDASLSSSLAGGTNGDVGINTAPNTGNTSDSFASVVATNGGKANSKQVTYVNNSPYGTTFYTAQNAFGFTKPTGSYNINQLEKLNIKG